MTYRHHFPIIVVFLALMSVCTVHAQGLDIPFSVTSDENGYVYLAGSSVDADGRANIHIIAYDTDGTVWREFTLPARGIGHADVSGVALIDSLLVVAGTMVASAGDLDMTAAGFHRPSLVSADEPGLPIPSIVLEQSYPNPVPRGATVRINYTTGSAGHLAVRVLDLFGRTVAVLADRHHSPGSYSAELPTARLSAGVYLYVLTASDATEIRRLTVLR
ncbi:MAG: T9SS type A sorting domain-containing protein [Bacteroidia bacterium]|nr:T9SS type A sorting domain-containing protein [Bacteroidia bacterium]